MYGLIEGEEAWMMQESTRMMEIEDMHLQYSPGE